MGTIGTRKATPSETARYAVSMLTRADRATTFEGEQTILKVYGLCGYAQDVMTSSQSSQSESS